ncbi:hypothetical protein UCDDS831_g04854 [Diplodia seriata]|uniref:Uncharacterized protein n=1 Tax=Diplodia seriata TaxID=420778 RepID=A0A0G2GUE2_9PEZI|nr:hypothetical protein UCDDS831_g04854 [Diplodia seriata]
MLDAECLKLPITTCHPTVEEKVVLLNAIWNNQVDFKASKAQPLDIDPYLEYYAQQCHIFSLEQSCYLPSDGSSGFRISVHTSKPEIKEEKDSAPNDHVINNAIDWAARLVTMMDIGQPHCAYSAHRPLLWDKDSLRAFVSNHFEPARQSAGYVRLPKLFNARNLELLAGIKVSWTNNLSDHLRLRDDDKEVLVFHHATFLEQSRTDIFPPGFCKETLRTLSLLLPSSDKRTAKWYKKQRSLENLDGRAVRLPHLRTDDRQIENFHFWRERLVLLKQVFDEAEPSSLSQWWYDRRKGPQWYTFWVAVAVLFLTVFFGIVQSVEGALQVYRAYHPGGPGAH